MDLRIREGCAKRRFEASKNEGDMRWTVGAGQAEPLGRLDGAERHQAPPLDPLPRSRAGLAADHQRSGDHPTSGKLSGRPANIDQSTAHPLGNPGTGSAEDDDLSAHDAS